MAVLVVKLAAALALLVHVLAGPAPGVGGAQVREAAGGDTYVTAYLNVTYRDVRGELHSERSETAKFGDGRIAGARGLLVHVASPNAPGGCSPPLLRAPTRARNSSALPAEPWIALVPRGHCTFDMKVHTAALAGAAAVIVYDDKEGDSLDMMDISPEHNITAVLTYHWKGVALVKLADSLHRVFVDIAVANRCTRSLNSINRTSVLFVSVSFIVLMIISLAWLVFYYVQRFRYIHAKDRLSRRLCTAAKRALSKIPTRRLKIDDAAVSGDGDCCAVCIERFRAAELVRTLPCRHEFHKGCIDPWLLEHRTCPMCKMDILKHYGFVFTGSQESILHLDIEEVAAFGLESPHLQPPRALLQQVREAPLHPPVIIAHLGQAGHAPQADDELPSITCGAPQTGPDPAPPPRADDVAPEGCARMQPQDGKVRAKVALDTLDTLDTLARVHGRPASPGAVSVASMASCGSTSSGSSSSSDSSSSVTDSILPPSKRPQPQIVGGDATQP